MLTYSLWFCMLGVDALVIVLGIRTRLSRQYIAFYLFLFSFLLVGLIRFYVYTARPSDYLFVFWWTEFLLVCAGYGVTWEIFNKTLANYRGVLRMARRVVSAIFFLALIQAFANFWSSETGSFFRSVIRLERNMLVVQATLLSLLALLILYYKIPLGKNLAGLLYGYGLRISAYVLVLTARFYLGPASNSWLDMLRQSGDLGVMVIWAIALRSYQPSPQPEGDTRLEQDYAALAEQTGKALAAARAQIARVFTS